MNKMVENSTNEAPQPSERNLKIIRNAKKVIISGGVAVGKSSRIDQVIKYLNVMNIKYIYVPEYIDEKADGLEMLQKYLNGVISVFTFQKYVIEYYDEYLRNLDLSKYSENEELIILFERGIDDAITCFTNLDYNNKNKSITSDEVIKLYNLAISIDKKYDIPSYFIKDDKIFIPIQTEDYKRDGNIIGSIITNRSKNNIIIGLYNFNDTCFNRMMERNRPGEK